MLSAESLEEVARSRIVIHLYRNLVYSRQRVHDCEIFLCIFQLLQVENVAVLKSDIVFFVEESLSLNTGHVKYIKLRHRFVKAFHFNPLCACGIHLFLYVFRHLQFLW